MKKYVVLIVGLITGIVSIGAVASGNKLTLEGSTTVLPISQRAAEAFMNLHKDADISVRGGGSGVGITSLLDGTCDIADSSRRISDGELKIAAGRGITPKANVISMDGIAIVVNPSNSVNALTKKQVGIFTRAWSRTGPRSAAARERSS